MDFCSDIFRGLCFFGGYPNEEQFKELISENILTFIDLTTERERSVLPFNYVHSSLFPRINYINFPVMDNQVPRNKKAFLDLVLEIVKKLHGKTKIYIHCKGGHGRSGLVVASVLCYLFNLRPEESIKLTSYHHSKRPNLKSKWKNIVCPQMLQQQKFVVDIFQPIMVTYTDYHTHMEKDPNKFLNYLGLRPIVSKTNPVVSDLLHYIRKIHHQSKQVVGSEKKW